MSLRNCVLEEMLDGALLVSADFFGGSTASLETAETFLVAALSAFCWQFWHFLITVRRKVLVTNLGVQIF